MVDLCQNRCDGAENRVLMGGGKQISDGITKVKNVIHFDVLQSTM